jgi:protein SCO1/2
MSEENMRSMAIAAAIIFVPFVFVSCNKGSNQPAVEMASPVQPAKRYHLKGKVVSVDRQAKMANIDADAIPGFMAAMTMPYPVKPADELNKLSAGDTITADVVVQNEDAWLENVLVTGHAGGPAPK